jgi:aspartate dehydrogenase
MRKLKIGIVGCGTIGTEIAKACQTRMRNAASLVGICDSNEEKAVFLKKALKGKVPILKIDDLVRKADLIVEAASAKASLSLLKKAISRKKNILIMSIGALLGNESLLEKCAKAGIGVYLPSGAICGVDGLKSASVGRIDSVTLTTRKPLKALNGAPYLKRNNINVWAIKEETVIFNGNAQDAVKGFPQNVNVCAILSLAGLGARDTRVKIITSPAYTKNIHEIEIEGEFGRIVTRIENVPSKTNPKTSQLAVFSAIATLEGIARSVRIGT